MIKIVTKLNYIYFYFCKRFQLLVLETLSLVMEVNIAFLKKDEQGKEFLLSQLNNRKII